MKYYSIYKCIMKYVIYRYQEYNFTRGFVIIAVTDTEEDAKKLVKDKSYNYERVKYIKGEKQKEGSKKNKEKTNIFL